MLHLDVDKVALYRREAAARANKREGRRYVLPEAKLG